MSSQAHEFIAQLLTEGGILRSKNAIQALNTESTSHLLMLNQKESLVVGRILQTTRDNVKHVWKHGHTRIGCDDKLPEVTSVYSKNASKSFFVMVIAKIWGSKRKLKSEQTTPIGLNSKSVTSSSNLSRPDLASIYAEQLAWENYNVCAFLDAISKHSSVMFAKWESIHTKTQSPQNNKSHKNEKSRSSKSKSSSSKSRAEITKTKRQSFRAFMNEWAIHFPKLLFRMKQPLAIDLKMNRRGTFWMSMIPHRGNKYASLLTTKRMTNSNMNV